MNKAKSFKCVMFSLAITLGLGNSLANAFAISNRTNSAADSAALKYVNMVEPLRASSTMTNDTGLARILDARLKSVNPCDKAITNELLAVNWCMVNGFGMPDFQPVGFEQFKFSNTVKNTVYYPPTKKNNYDSYAKVFVKTIVHNGSGVAIRNINRLLTLEKISGEWKVIAQVFK